MHLPTIQQRQPESWGTFLAFEKSAAPSATLRPGMASRGNYSTDIGPSALPLIDDVTLKDAVADFCTGLNFAHGNLHVTFASVTADHSVDDAPPRRIVSARIVMPIPGAIELRDLLTQVIDALTAQGVIVPETPSPTVMTPPGGRPHCEFSDFRRHLHFGEVAEG